MLTLLTVYGWWLPQNLKYSYWAINIKESMRTMCMTWLCCHCFSMWASVGDFTHFYMNITGSGVCAGNPDISSVNVLFYNPIIILLDNWKNTIILSFLIRSGLVALYLVCASFLSPFIHITVSPKGQSLILILNININIINVCYVRNLYPGYFLLPAFKCFSISWMSKMIFFSVSRNILSYMVTFPFKCLWNANSQNTLS